MALLFPGLFQKKTFKNPALLLVLMAALLPLGCEKKPKAEAPAPAAETSAQESEAIQFEGLLAKAASDETAFADVCRLLLTRSVLLPLDRLPEPAKSEDGAAAQPKKISIKVLKEKDKEGPGSAILFSGKQALALAGDKLQWPKNEKGMYSFAAMNGQSVFRVLQANGYKRVIVDVAGANPLIFDEASLAELAQGKVPAFPAKK